MKVLITGSSGLVGSELVAHFDRRATKVVGIDNNMRCDFFGMDGDTSWNLSRLQSVTRNFEPVSLDIRDRKSLARVFQTEGPFDLVVHCAAQPSHDLAARRPLDDFDINATGTLNILESTRQLSRDAVFVFLSTNKVYGDAPNELPLKELSHRWEYARLVDYDGITEEMRIDRSQHSIFGAGKVAADVMVQEYGKYFDMNTTCLRCGCLTGPFHSGVQLHGFLSFLTKVHLQRLEFHILGYKGKQVRDNLHSADVATAVEAILHNPGRGAVFNLGGGRQNSCSIIEAIDRLQQLTGIAMHSTYVDKHRTGDHICYISNTARFQESYPEWTVTRSLDDVLREMVELWSHRLKHSSAA